MLLIVVDLLFNDVLSRGVLGIRTTLTMLKTYLIIQHDLSKCQKLYEGLQIELILKGEMSL